MFAIFVGAAVALIVFGLPLAIIGLFVASIIDRGNKATAEGRPDSEVRRPEASLRRSTKVRDKLTHLSPLSSVSTRVKLS